MTSVIKDEMRLSVMAFVLNYFSCNVFSASNFLSYSLFYQLINPNLSRLCKGYTLYAHIHVHGTKFEDAKLISIIQQIAQVGFFYFNIWLRVCFLNNTSKSNIRLKKSKKGVIHKIELSVNLNCRSSRPELFCRKSVWKKIIKFLGRKLCWSLQKHNLQWNCAANISFFSQNIFHFIWLKICYCLKLHCCV